MLSDTVAVSVVALVVPACRVIGLPLLIVTEETTGLTLFTVNVEREPCRPDEDPRPFESNIYGYEL